MVKDEMSFLEFKALAAKELGLSVAVDGVQYDSVTVERVPPRAFLGPDEIGDVSCAGCSGLATPTPHFGSDCTCAHGSCDTCGAPYRNADEQKTQRCSQCEEQYEAERTRREAERMNRVTAVVPAVTDFQAEALRRMGAR